MHRLVHALTLVAVLSVPLAAQTPPPPAQTTPPPAQAPPVRPPTVTPAPPPVAGVRTPPPRPNPDRVVPPQKTIQGSVLTPKPVAPARSPQRALQNVRLEVTISDTLGTAGSRKTVMMLIANGNSGRIRSSNDVAVGGTLRPITINIDAVPEIRDDEILLNLSVEYIPELSTGAQSTSTPRPASINEAITVVVADNAPTVISQSADPATDRKVTVEVKATVVR